MFGKALKLFLLLMAGYLLLGAVAWMMPDWRVVKHVRDSLDGGELRDDYPKAIIVAHSWTQDQYTMDNFTDALILNQCIHLRSDGWRSGLTVPRYDEKAPQCVNLLKAMDSDTVAGKMVTYPRYWHGNTYITRILLTFMSFRSVRYLIYLVSTVLLLWCTGRLWRRVSPLVAVAIVASLLLVNVYVMQFSVQFAQVLIIALGGMLWLTYHRQPGKAGMALLFGVLGSLTAYFDLLTVPTLTLGLPLVVAVALREDEKIGGALWGVLRLCIWWAGAYVLTWAGKWGIATLLTGENVFANATGQAAVWQEDGGSYIGEAFSLIFGKIKWVYVLLLAVLLTVAAAVYHRRGRWIQTAQYALVLAIPIVYYLAMPHHTQHHSWFCYRGLATSIAALLMMIATWVDWQRCRKGLTKILKKCHGKNNAHK